MRMTAICTEGTDSHRIQLGEWGSSVSTAENEGSGAGRSEFKGSEFAVYLLVPRGNADNGLVRTESARVR